MIRKLRVRMYRVGFGDCFLLTFEGDEGRKHVLIDCGSITEDKVHVGKVVADVLAQCDRPGGAGARIELVVCTHRHRDHAGGFKDPAWKGVEVGQVWMPWTEDPDDPTARRILNRQSAFALALAMALGPRKFDADAETPLATLELGAVPSKRGAAYAVALNALTNEVAMSTLHKGFAGRPERHFLPRKDTLCEARTLDGMPGLRIHVLGPPRDEAAIADMEPPESESWRRLARRAAARGAAADAEPADPEQGDGAFRASWRIDRAAFLERFPETSFNDADEREATDLAEEPDGDLAAAIDRAVNNTSLILMFEVAGQWLLFPGDAQWGDWSGAMKDPTCRRLLERTTLYKVGHHGSENATPRDLVKQVFSGPYTALLSTRAMTQWPNLPFDDLLTTMTGKGATMIRSDTAPDLFVDWEVDLDTWP